MEEINADIIKVIDMATQYPWVDLHGSLRHVFWRLCWSLMRDKIPFGKKDTLHLFLSCLNIENVCVFQGYLIQKFFIKPVFD